MLRKFDYFEMRPSGSDPANKFTSGEYYYLTTICEYLNIQSEEEIKYALARVFEACRSLDISFEENFLQFYHHKNENIYKDWKISRLGLYLFLINSNTSNPKVAQVQIYFFNN